MSAVGQSWGIVAQNETIVIIDAHHHFWNYSEKSFAWVTEEMTVLRQDFLPQHFETTLRSAGVSGTIAVQARTSLEETYWLLDLAARHEFIQGVVGWVPLKDASVGDILDRLAANRLFRGVRDVIQGAPDPVFFDCPDFNRGIRELTLRSIPFDLLIFHNQIARATQFVDAHPNQRFILDHIGKPEIRNDLSEDWAREIKNLSQRQNVFCKFSGLITQIPSPIWDVELVRPYYETVLEAFGSNRLMFGSDWPVCLLRTDYSQWLAVTKELSKGLCESDSEAFFSKTASSVYAC
jgi:L-fuconolactonase